MLFYLYNIVKTHLISVSTLSLVVVNGFVKISNFSYFLNFFLYLLTCVYSFSIKDRTYLYNLLYLLYQQLYILFLIYLIYFIFIFNCD